VNLPWLETRSGTPCQTPSIDVNTAHQNPIRKNQCPVGPSNTFNCSAIRFKPSSAPSPTGLRKTSARPRKCSLCSPSSSAVWPTSFSRPRSSPPPYAAAWNKPTGPPLISSDARHLAKRRVASEQLVAAESRHDDLHACFGREPADKIGIDAVACRLVHPREDAGTRNWCNRLLCGRHSTHAKGPKRSLTENSEYAGSPPFRANARIRPGFALSRPIQ